VTCLQGRHGWSCFSNALGPEWVDSAISGGKFFLRKPRHPVVRSQRQARSASAMLALCRIVNLRKRTAHWHEEDSNL
jgi:hypothetical protein